MFSELLEYFVTYFPVLAGWVLALVFSPEEYKGIIIVIGSSGLTISMCLTDIVNEIRKKGEK